MPLHHEMVRKISGSGHRYHRWKARPAVAISIVSRGRGENFRRYTVIPGARELVPGGLAAG
jgi:hypothetical protein